MNLFTRNSPYCHLFKYLLFLMKHPVYYEHGLRAINRFTRSSDLSVFQKKVKINVREKILMVGTWMGYRNIYLASHYAPLVRVTTELINTWCEKDCKWLCSIKLDSQFWQTGVRIKKIFRCFYIVIISCNQIGHISNYIIRYEVSFHEI